MHLFIFVVASYFTYETLTTFLDQEKQNTFQFLCSFWFIVSNWNFAYYDDH